MEHGIYRHSKGGLYFVVGVAHDSNNSAPEGSEQVVYWSDDYKHLCVRARSEFEERVIWPDGFERPRFVREPSKPGASIADALKPLVKER